MSEKANNLFEEFKNLYTTSCATEDLISDLRMAYIEKPEATTEIARIKSKIGQSLSALYDAGESFRTKALEIKTPDKGDSP